MVAGKSLTIIGSGPDYSPVSLRASDVVVASNAAVGHFREIDSSKNLRVWVFGSGLLQANLEQAGNPRISRKIRSIEGAEVDLAINASFYDEVEARKRLRHVPVHFDYLEPYDFSELGQQLVSLGILKSAPRHARWWLHFGLRKDFFSYLNYIKSHPPRSEMPPMCLRPSTGVMSFLWAMRQFAVSRVHFTGISLFSTGNLLATRTNQGPSRLIIPGRRDHALLDYEALRLTLLGFNDWQFSCDRTQKALEASQIGRVPGFRGKPAQSTRT